MAKKDQSNRSKRASSRRALHDLRKVAEKQVDNALTAAVMTRAGRDSQDFVNQALDAKKMLLDIEKGIVDLEKFYQEDMIAPMNGQDRDEIYHLHSTGLYNIYELAHFYDLGFGEVFEIIQK